MVSTAAVTWRLDCGYIAMLMRLANLLLQPLGYRLVADRRVARTTKAPRPHEQAREILSRISSAPMDAAAHAEYAAFALRRQQLFLAHSQARNAQWLQPDNGAYGELVRTTEASLPALQTLGHNAYHRLHALASILGELGCGPGSSVLDVGGGHGQLAAFLPASRYFLADPTSNGLGATDLPPALGPFDYVVSCHVLEHIEPAARGAFIDALVSRMRSAVVLLNPFHIEGASEEERLRLVIDLTGAPWAREHLECTLPHLDDVHSYAKARRLHFSIRPVGAFTTAFAYVFVEHFANRAGAADEMSRINTFFNERLCDAETSEQFPTGFAVMLQRDPAKSGESGVS